MILNLPSSSLKKIDFLMKKCTFGKEWLMGSEMRMSDFFIKKSIFSKFLKLWGNISYCIWTGFEVLFQPLNDFQPTFTVFEKNPFFDEKNAFLVRDGLWVQKWEWTFFLIKKSIFFKDDEGRFKIIQRLKQDPKAGPNTMGKFAERFRNFEKIDFLQNKW